MSRKPTTEDALLLALFEAGENGLDIIKWHAMKPSEFNISLDDFIEKVDKMRKDGLVDFLKFGESLLSQKYKLTEKGKFEAHNIGNEIDRDSFISLVTRVSPEVEIRKRIENIETFIISSIFAFLGFLGLESGLKNPNNFPLYINFSIIMLYLLIFIVGLIYSISNFMQIFEFWGYYVSRYGKTRNRIFILYKNHEKNIKRTYRFVILPLIALLISIYGLGMNTEYALGTLILTIIGQLILPKQN